MNDSPNPFRNGNYAPWREEGDAFHFRMEGELPLKPHQGVEPTCPELGTSSCSAVTIRFDGDEMAYAPPVLGDGRAAYRSR